MSEPLSDVDKIRNKRLAKLSAQSTTPSTSLPSESPSSSSPQQQTSTNPAGTGGADVSKQQDDVVEPQEQGKRVKITPTSSTTTLSNVASPSPSPAPPKRAPAKQEESIEAFEDRTLRALFCITLSESKKKDMHGHTLTFLPGVLAELQDENLDIRITTGVLDQAILEAASNTGHDSPLDYLLPCWKRVRRLIKGFRKTSDDDPRFAVVSEAKRLCISYSIFAITMPDMFASQTASVLSPLLPHLLLDAEDDRGVDFDLLSEIVKQFDEQDDLKQLIITTVEQLSEQLSTKTMNDDFKPYVSALRNLVHHAAVGCAITESSKFLSSTDAPTFELSTLLGPWFRLSPLQAQVTMTYFSSPKTRDQGFILNSQRSLRMTQQLLSSDLLDIINHLIRASKDSREKVLDWFAAAINLNHKRRAMQVDPKTVSSDGFMFNITTCLDQLCEPFMDATFTKIDRIDANYLHRDPRVQISDETKINADQQTSDEFYSKRADGTSNFISEVFFLTVAAHHYGSESLTSKLETLDKDIRHIESKINEFELERHKWTHNPIQLRMFDDAVKKWKDRLDLGIALKYSLQGVLFDTLWQTRSMQFMRYVIVWLLRMVSAADFPKQQLVLPLPKEAQAFSCLPEYFIDDIVSNFKFIMWSMPQIITATQGDELVMLCITFLENSQYIKNPYLKAGLVSILYRGTWPRPGGARGVLVDLLNSMPFANKHLLHAVMKFYIEAEHTGTHTQFYDKFNIRYEIFQIIKCIWGNPAYRSQLSDQAKDNLDFFVQFVNLLLNDVTFILDESFTTFITIHDTQELLNREGDTMEQAVRQEKEEVLSQAQSRAKSYMQMTNETVAMLKLFTEALADSFTMPEIVQRLADMLDYNLDAMVGPKSSNLQVGNLQEYGFQPRALLSEIVDVYLNLMNKESFVFAVARDGRSYKPQNFDKAAEIIRKWSLKSDEDLFKWRELQKRVNNAKLADEQAEEDLGEVPDEFLDPLMYTLMEDPVILPNSKVTIDRATIRSHLLSDPNDPFNRAPLKIEDVIPNVDLKKQIEDFKAERKAAKLDAMKNDSMDTSTG